MTGIEEKGRMLRVLFDCDVLVCGGGIAGIAAAVAAARNGARVTLLEREYALGGLATLGLITIYLPMCDGLGHQAEYGLVEELLRLSIKHGAEKDYTELFFQPHTVEERRAGPRLTAQFNPEFFALEAEKLLLELGVNIQYGTLVCGVAMKDGNKVDAVIVENKSERCAIRCKSVVDATGDSYVVKYADAGHVLYGGDNGLASWYYYYAGQEINLRMYGLSDVVPGENQSSNSWDNDVDTVIAGSRRYRGLDGVELSEMVADGHQHMLADMLLHKAQSPDFAPTTMSTIPLLRMTRRLAGAYEMDADEIEVYMPDSVGTFCDWRKRGPLYELPFRTLYSSTVPNLLVAGRNISVSDDMWDITRVIPVCAVSGEAAGTAAALSDNFPELDVTELQRHLQAQGVRLHCADIREKSESERKGNGS
ncbi:FAD-dependent oxidoreductase [Flavonifractor hominis]|uniref:FAD-dependent oxidoreductase n=1 Tax=Flavonifractor hominis TaxID=3133178 RepID=A0ABV1EP64_9FIRM